MKRELETERVRAFPYGPAREGWPNEVVVSEPVVENWNERLPLCVSIVHRSLRFLLLLHFSLFFSFSFPLLLFFFPPVLLATTCWLCSLCHKLMKSWCRASFMVGPAQRTWLKVGAHLYLALVKGLFASTHKSTCIVTEISCSSKRWPSKRCAP